MDIGQGLPPELSARPWVRVEFSGGMALNSGAQNLGDQLAVLRGVGKVEEFEKLTPT